MRYSIPTTIVLTVATALSSTTSLLARADSGEPTTVAKSDLRAGPPRTAKMKSASAKRVAKGIWKTYTAAVETSRRAVTERSSTKKARLYRSAAKRLERMLFQLNRWEKKHRSDNIVLEEARRMRGQILGAAKRAYFDLASALTSRGSYKQAMDAIYMILRREPSNARARDELRRIQLIMATAR